MNELDNGVIDKAIATAIEEAERRAIERDVPTSVHPRVFQLGATATIPDRSVFDAGTPENPRELGDPEMPMILDGILAAGLNVRV